jgi:hypothetical protein
MLNQLQRGDEPALQPCRRSGFLRRPYLCALAQALSAPELPLMDDSHCRNNYGSHQTSVHQVDPILLSGGGS